MNKFLNKIIKEWRYDMKNNILLFVIGVLVGAVIATGAFFVYSKTTNTNDNQQTQVNGGTPPSMPSNDNNQNGQPPAMPNNSNNTQSNSDIQNSNDTQSSNN